MIIEIALLFTFFSGTSAQLHDVEVTTRPSWAPTGRLNQFNGFATPRTNLLPDNAQMMYASVWAAWSAWSFCADARRIRVRACNTVRGFRCLGPNQETEPCDMSTSPIRGVPRDSGEVAANNDYDIVDPWQEDRIEALKQLYPDESIDEKLSRLPEHEKQRLLTRIAPPNLVSHELLSRPQNDETGAPGATPEKMFGAHPKAFAVKSAATEPIKLLAEDFRDATDITGDKQNVQFIPFLGRDGESEVKAAKNRGEGKLVRKTKITTTTTEPPFDPDAIFNMDGPRFSGKDFRNDVFGNVDDLVDPTTTTSTTTTPEPTTTTVTTTTVTPAPTTTTTTPAPTTTTVYREPTRVTPRLPANIDIDEKVELVTPAIEPPPVPSTTPSEPEAILPEEVSFFEAEDFLTTTTRKPFKMALHDGEVAIPKTLPAEISLDTLHALDWMLANMTKAAEQGQSIDVFGNELRDLTSTTTDASTSNKKIVKKPKTKKKRVKNSRLVKLHYGEIEAPPKMRKFPKFQRKTSHRAKMFGIRTAGGSRETLDERKTEIIEEINDIQDLMEQLDERTESRSALMESTKHEHNSPYV